MNIPADITAFTQPREVHSELTNLFPSQNSFKWFLRRNQRELASEGAAIIVAERLLLHRERFLAYVLRTGLERAGACSQLKA